MRRAGGTAASETTRERLIAVAQQLFRERGYEGTSLAAVAERLQISAPAVYYHFQSKDQLLFETQEAYARDMFSELEQATSRGTAVERLETFVPTHVRAQLESLSASDRRHTYGIPHLIAVLDGEPRERLRRLSRRVLELLREIIRQGVADGSFDPVDPTATAFAIIGMDHHIVLWFRAAGPLDCDGLVATQVELARRMVGMRAPAARADRSRAGVARPAFGRTAATSPSERRTGAAAARRRRGR
jgi:AcrR family transcriptional regulator